MSLGIDGSLGTTSLGLGDVGSRTEYGFLLFDYEPNSKDDYILEILNWRTDVIEAHKGNEQRRGLRAIPRRTFTYTHNAIGQRANTLEALIYGSSNQVFALPVWTDAATLTQAANTTTDIYTDFSNRGFFAGGYVVIYESPTKFEFARVASFDNGFFSITEETFYNWPAGAKVYPIVFAHVDTPSTVTWFTSNALSADLSLSLSPTDASFNLPVANPATTYLDIEVLELRPNWLGDMSNVITTDHMEIDAGVGLFDKYFGKSHSRFVRGFKWFLNGRQNIGEFRKFLQRRKGQLNPFWLARTYDDLTFVDNVQSTDFELTFDGTAHAFYVGMNKGRNHISIYLRNGTKVYAQIETANILSGNMVLVLTAPIGVSFSIDDVVQVSFLTLSRLAADQVTIPWWTNEFADPETYFKSLI